MVRHGRSGAFAFFARFAPFALAGSLLLVPAGASAADPTMGQDEVSLKDGGSIRGTVVSSEPGVSVKIIELGETAARTIPWAQVSGVERGRYAPNAEMTVPLAPPPPPSAPPPPPSEPEPRVRMPVRLHISSPVQATVVAREEYARIGWTSIGFEREVCASPCDQIFDGSTGHTYSLTGDFPTSPSFSLTGRRGTVDVDLSPGSRGLRAGGIVLIALGGAAVLIGAGFATVGAMQSSTSTVSYNADGTTTRTPNSGASAETVGFVVLGGGVAAIIGGVVALVSSKSTIDVHGRGEAKEAVAPAPRYWAGEF